MTRIALISPLEESPPLEGFSRIVNLPRYGTTAVATALRDAGYEIRVFCEFVRCPVDWDYVLSAHYVCFSLLSYCSHRAYEMAQKIRAASKAPIIFGGSHPSVLPEDCLEHGDYAIRNEGEGTVLELLAALERGEGPEGILGLSYRGRDGKIVHNPDRPFLDDIDRVPDISLLENYRPLGWIATARNFLRHHRLWVNAQLLQTSRGCPFHCTFCFGRVELGNRYRTRSIDAVVTDIRRKLEVLKTPWFYVVDNEFTIDRRRTKALLRRLIEEFGGGLRLLVFARSEASRDTELLQLMKKAGVYRVYVGIESVTDASLAEYQKAQTVAKVERSLEAFYRQGLEVFASLVLGADADTRESVRETFEFLIEHRVQAICMLALYDFPTKQRILGTPQVWPDPRIIHHDWRFFNGNFVIHYPRRMKPSTLQREMIDGTRRFYALPRRLAGLARGNVDYIAQYQSLKPVLETMERYAQVLERFEDGLYDDGGTLIEDRLANGPEAGYATRLPV